MGRKSKFDVKVYKSGTVYLSRPLREELGSQYVIVVPIVDEKAIMLIPTDDQDGAYKISDSGLLGVRAWVKMFGCHLKGYKFDRKSKTLIIWLTDKG